MRPRRSWVDAAAAKLGRRSDRCGETLLKNAFFVAASDSSSSSHLWWGRATAAAVVAGE